MSDGCTEVSPLCPVEASTYGYYPNLGGNIFFTVFYGLCGLFQVGFGLYYRSWSFATALVLGAFLEMAGYVGRVLMNDNPWFPPAFKLQIVCLILAPTFVAAGVYLTLKHIILYLGPEHSRLKPRLFTWIFIGCDVGSLILQAAGGGVAAAAGNDQEVLKIGDDIIIAGIAFQVATMATCGILALEFFIRVWKTGTGLSPAKEESDDFRPMSSTKIKLAIAGEVFAYFTVLIRCIYRYVHIYSLHRFDARLTTASIPEMAGGWGNPLMRKEDEFLVLDGMCVCPYTCFTSNDADANMLRRMIALAVLSFTVAHPAFYLRTIRKGTWRRAQVP